jgi:hypothetical protein
VTGSLGSLDWGSCALRCRCRIPCATERPEPSRPGLSLARGFRHSEPCAPAREWSIPADCRFAQRASASVRLTRTLGARPERARAWPHQRRLPCQRSSGDSARVAAWPLLTFVRGGSDRRIERGVGDRSLGRDAPALTRARLLDTLAALGAGTITLGMGTVGSPATFGWDAAAGGERSRGRGARRVDRRPEAPVRLSSGGSPSADVVVSCV